MMRAARIAACALLCASSASAQQGALELFVGETLFVSGTRLALTWLSIESNELALNGDAVPNPNGLERQRDFLVASMATNISRGLDFAMVLPWAMASATFESGGAVLSTDDGDIGDLALVLKKRVHHEPWNRGAWNVSVLGGVETPTGRTSLSTGGVRLPVRLQPGSGSWDPFLGVASTLGLGRLRLDYQMFWQTFGEGAQGSRPGDVISAEFDVGYRVLMTRYPGPTVSAKAGVRWRHQDRGEQFGGPRPNNGSEELAVHLATTWHPAPEWDVSFKYEVPVYEDRTGLQLETDYRLLLGIGIRF